MQPQLILLENAIAWTMWSWLQYVLAMLPWVILLKRAVARTLQSWLHCDMKGAGELVRSTSMLTKKFPTGTCYAQTLRSW